MMNVHLPSQDELMAQERARLQWGPQEQEINRLKHTPFQRVLCIAVAIALLLFLLIGILGDNVFHFL